MPESTEVRKLAATVAKELGKVPWHTHREEVLPVVYARLGLGAYTTPKKKTSRKRQADAPAVTTECSVCLTEMQLLILAPCGHKCVCAMCCSQLQKCPLCRCRIVSSVQSVY